MFILPSTFSTLLNVAVAPNVAGPEADNIFACKTLENIPVAPATVLEATI